VFDPGHLPVPEPGCLVFPLSIPFEGENMRNPRKASGSTGIHWFGILLVAWGCSLQVGSAFPQADPAREEPSGPVDRSLTPEEYVKLGLPGHEKAWSTAEMVAASKALAALAQKEPQSLPRYQSKRSGQVFARITAAENLAPFRDQSPPIRPRLAQAIEFGRAANNIMKLYAEAFQRGFVGGSDMAELLAMDLRNAVALTRLARELIPTIQKDDPKYLARMEGLAIMRRGLATTFSGVLITLTERPPYSAQDLRRLLATMQETLPLLAQELVPEHRRVVVARLQALETDPRLSDLRAEVKSLSKSVLDAVAKAGKADSDRPGLRLEDLKKLGITMHRSQTGDPDASGWCLARSTGGHFTVMLPGRFNDSMQTGKADDGVDLVSHALATTTLEGAKFMVFAVIRPDRKFPSSGLDKLAQNLKKQGSEVELSKVQMAGLPAAELKVKGPDNSAVMRSFQAGDTQYMLMVEYPSIPLGDLITKSTKKFFESFTLPPEPKK